MKTLLRKSVLILFALVTVLLISWDYLKNSEPADDDYGRNVSYDLYEPMEAGRTSYVPPAEDVLVKRIPGDKDHLLVLAYYSKNLNAVSQFSINIGNDDLVFRDDGRGFDERAGDGYYTARVATSVTRFKNEATNIYRQMLANKDALYRFENRAVVSEASLPTFSVEKLENGSAISIASLKQPFVNKWIDTIMKNCIFLTDLSVVEDPSRTWNPCTQTGNLNGSWTFKTLFQQLASEDLDHIADETQTSDFVKNWLSLFLQNRIINGDTVWARPKLKELLLDPWLAKSLAAGNPEGFLDMRFAPFKLTAILNRFDLRTRFSQIPLGEARFVFSLIDSGCTESLPFTFILEYGVAKGNICDSLKSWASRWFNLASLKRGSPEYNQALQDITDQVSLCGSAKNKANQSSLNNLRTNDRAFSPDPVISEFREFHLSGKTHQIIAATVAQVPADRYNVQEENADVQRLAKYINERADSIINDLYTIPNIYEGEPLLAGVAHILGNPLGDPRVGPVYHWDGVKNKKSASFIQNFMARHVFSLNSCTGCHSGEFQTDFFHVEPAFFGDEAALSGFLTGRPQPGAYDADLNPNDDFLRVIDPALRPTKNPSVRKFNDIMRRAKDLQKVNNATCGSVFQIRDALMFQPINSPH